MNTINLKSNPNVTIHLPRIELGQKITVHNPNTGEIITFKNELEAGNPAAAEPAQKRWRPKKYGEPYGYIDSCGDWIGTKWSDSKIDKHRHATGNLYYQPHKRERAIWEQVTRRKYETALWDAADWVEGEKDGWIGCFDFDDNKIIALNPYKKRCFNLPRFATEQSAIDAHTRILGDDAERYFKGRG
jgi:hypothetical protein